MTHVCCMWCVLLAATEPEDSLARILAAAVPATATPSPFLPSNPFAPDSPSFPHSSVKRMITRTQQRRDTAARGAAEGCSHSRSRSRERDALLLPPPPQQLLPVSHAVAAIDAAYGDRPRSISRLHDDELTCVLSILPLEELAVVVRCSRRFNGIARRERGRALHI
jgi:hypothetical protein